MPNSLIVKGTTATVYSGAREVAQIQDWTLEMIGGGRFAISAETLSADVTRWPFRDKTEQLIVELPIRRTQRRYRVMLSSESPFAGEATLDANTAEDGGFW